MASWRPRSLTRLLVVLTVLLAPLALVSNVSADTTDTAGNLVVTRATTPTQSNVAPNGPLTGLKNLDVITVNVTADGSGTPPANNVIFGMDARLCRTGLNIVLLSQFNASAGNCIANPLSAGSTAIVQQAFAPPNTSGTLSFIVGTGAETAATHVGPGAPIVCDSTHPCSLWLRQSVPTGVISSGNAFVHYDLQFAAPATGSVDGIMATVPGSDPHKVNVKIDGVTIGSPIGSGQETGAQPIAAGTHTMSVTGAGDTDMSKYIVLFYGQCNVTTGELTVVAGATTYSAAILIHTSNPQPALSVSDPQIVRPASGTAQAVFTVSLVGGSFFPSTVNYTTQDGTATTAAGDYTAKSGTLSFPAGGSSTQTVSVPITASSRHDPTRAFNLVLSGASGAAVADAVGTATLISRQAPLTVSAGDVDVVRSTAVNTTAAFTVRLSAAPAAGETVTVPVSTTNGTATSPTDYTALGATTVTFNAGETSKVVNVVVKPQPVATPTRTFNLAIGTPSSNAVVGDSSAVATLRSTGSAAPLPTLAASDAGTLRPASGSTTTAFTVSLSAASATPVTVNYATADGTATVAAGDYTAASGTLTFAAGQTSKTVSITTFATARHGGSSAFSLVLSAPSGATLADATGTARLINRNGPIGISVADTAVVRSASVAGTATLTLSLSTAPAAGESVTVKVATANGTAVAGTDYTSVALTTVTFAPGQQTATVAVPVSTRPSGTPIRAFSLALSAPSANAFLADAAGRVTLIGP